VRAAPRRLWRKRRGSAVEAEGERRRAGEEADAHAAARHMAVAAVSGKKKSVIREPGEQRSAAVAAWRSLISTGGRCRHRPPATALLVAHSLQAVRVPGPGRRHTDMSPRCGEPTARKAPGYRGV
jgi:hypothetical protein